MRGALGMLFSAMMSAGILATSLLGWLVTPKLILIFFCFKFSLVAWPESIEILVKHKWGKKKFDFPIFDLGLWTWRLILTCVLIYFKKGLALDFGHLYHFPRCGSRRSHFRAGFAILFGQTRYIVTIIKLSPRIVDNSSQWPLLRHTYSPIKQVRKTKKKSRQTIIYQSCVIFYTQKTGL